MPIHTLNIDLETKSGADISKTGVYRYAEDDHFDILLFGVSVNEDPVEVYDLANGEQIPEPILQALTDDSVIKHANNASFERVSVSPASVSLHPQRYSVFWAVTSNATPVKTLFLLSHFFSLRCGHSTTEIQ